MRFDNENSSALREAPDAERETENDQEAASALSECWLCELGVGQEGSVVEVRGEENLRRRLMEMGFCNQVRVAVVRRAPLGDPTQYRLRGYHVSLRRHEASRIRIKRGRINSGMGQMSGLSRG